MTPHLDWETINNWVDGALPPHERDEVRQHLRRCSDCLRQVEALEGMLRTTGEAPLELPPPDDVWPALRKAVEARKIVTLRSVPAVVPRPWWHARRSLLFVLAAAVVLVVSSSAITTLIVKSGDGGAAATVADNPEASATPVWYAEGEREFVESARELSAALEAARPRLSAEAIAIVERNLAIIDSAIAESRAVLRQDPENTVLFEVLAGTHRQKIDLLRRAAQLASS